MSQGSYVGEALGKSSAGSGASDKTEGVEKKMVELQSEVRKLTELVRGGKDSLVTSSEVPFWTLAGYLVKLAFAAIPAVLLVGALMFIVQVVLFNIFVGF